MVESYFSITLVKFDTIYIYFLWIDVLHKLIQGLDLQQLCIIFITLKKVWKSGGMGRICTITLGARSYYPLCVCVFQCLKKFVENFFDQNPLSQLGIISTSSSKAQLVSALSGKWSFPSSCPHLKSTDFSWKVTIAG